MSVDSLPNPNKLKAQAATLFEIHDDISRVIGELDLPLEDLSDEYRECDKSDDTFDFDAMLRVFLYKDVGQFKQKEVVREIRNWQYLQVRFGLDRAPTQPAISHTKKRRFSRHLRSFLTEVADRIRAVAKKQGIRDSDIASPQQGRNPGPEEVAESNTPLYEYVDQHAPEVITEFQSEVMTAFDTGRASNAKHSDEAIWEQQTVMSLMDRSGTRAAHRTFNKFRQDPVHHDTHTRAVKQLGTPNTYQFTLDEFASSGGNQTPTPRWRRVADTIQGQFTDAVTQLLDSVRTSETFSEPVVAAIDVTTVPFHVTPYKGEEDIGPDDQQIVVNEKTGRTRVPKDDYPEMVNGGKEKGVYGYQYATLTIVGRNVPIVVAVEPVRHASTWEGEDGDSVSWAETVDRLMEQATDVVDIHLVMADKAFDQPGVFHVLDQCHDVDYLIPKRTNSDHLRKQAEEVRTDAAVTARVEQAASLYLRDGTPYIDTDTDPTVGADGYSHDVTFMHVPAERDDWIVRHQDDTGYALFATNREDVSPLDAEGLTNRYSERWDIEIEYRMIQPLLPSIASTDYRMRLFSFVFSCLLYNVWRAVDHSLKELASEAREDYGRSSSEERLDPVLPLADFLTSSLIVAFRSGLDPPDPV
jgi:hypothetical protein